MSLSSDVTHSVTHSLTHPPTHSLTPFLIVLPKYLFMLPSLYSSFSKRYFRQNYDASFYVVDLFFRTPTTEHENGAKLLDQTAPEIPASRTFSKRTAEQTSTIFCKELLSEGIEILIFFYNIS